MLSGDMIDLVAASWIISIFLLTSRQNALAFAAVHSGHLILWDITFYSGKYFFK
jgi:hypothetical protein